jgi:predicted O-methyltransferase YrrM
MRMNPELPTEKEVDVRKTLRTDISKRARSISMLGETALSVLEQLAIRSNGPIIELGLYIGGSTIAMATGCRYGLVTIELGGENPRDDHLASKDIIANLRRNLRGANVAERVKIIQGHFRSAAVYDQAARDKAGARAGLLFIDVHPGTELALSLYARLLRDDAFVVVDDVQSESATEKAALVRGFIDKLKAAGILIEIGIFGWGTWFGKLAGGDARRQLIMQTAHLPSVHEGGLCWHLYADHELLSDYVIGNASPLSLLEDGRALGPPHCLHADIRAHGGGRFSHWGGHLWFSSADDSDPRLSGRRYSIRLKDRDIDLAANEPLPANN